MSRLDWDKARQRDLVRDRGAAPKDPAPRKKKRPDHQRGPTAEQQKEVARLCRKLGRPYAYPATALEAQRQIREMEALRV